jgi:hypothetical protein
MNQVTEVGADREVAVLHALGASSVEEVRDDDGVLTGYAVAPAISLAGYEAAAGLLLKADLLAHAESLRNQREAAGTLLDGVPIRTDRETRSALTEALAATDIDPDFTTPWVLSNGSVLQVGAANIRPIIGAVAVHRRGAFAAFVAVKARIEAGQVADRQQVETEMAL